ncbi:MAG: GLPGLI family protein [Bacteroidota bacterium]
MKKILSIAIAIFPVIICFAQQKEGKVVYERTTKMQIMINDNDHVSQNLPQTRTDKFELLFGNNLSLWHTSDEQTPEDDNGGGGGVQIRMIGGGVDDISYYDLNKGTGTQQTEMFDKKFLIADSVRKLNWKLTGESKTILNHTAQKATAQRIGVRTMMNMDNGKMERKEMADTSLIVAWFTPDIPVATGPAEYQGQLPGLILEMDINNGKQVYKATEISPKADIAAIKEPKNGKKVTRDEFRKETQKMMDEMQRNNQGGGRTIRINN